MAKNAFRGKKQNLMQCRLSLLILAVWWMKTVPSVYPQEYKYGSYWKQQLLFLTGAFFCFVFRGFFCKRGDFLSSFHKAEIICYRAAGDADSTAPYSASSIVLQGGIDLCQ